MAAGVGLEEYPLALSLLRDNRISQSDSARAVALVESASSAGDADATAMRALFEATGMGRPQSWEGAFNLLQLAAEQGSDAAGRQLLLLSDPTRDPVLSTTADAEFWGKTRRSISLDKLLRHRDRRALHNGPHVRVIDGFATPTECRWLIERATEMLTPALVVDIDGRLVADPVRTNKGAAFQLTDMDLVIEIIRARISAATRIPVPLFEPTQVLHYSVGEEFKHHLDYLEPGNPQHQEQLRSHGQRIATFLIYLNDDFEGGETEFSQIGIRYRGRVGDAIFWANCDMEGRPDPLTLHTGLPPTAGEKWILSQWIRDRAPPR